MSCGTQAEGETYLGEVGAISEAYEAVQEQNTRLLQQLTERDAANASLVSERIREGHSAAHMMEARDVAVAAAKRSGAECTALQGRVSGLESRLQVGWGCLFCCAGTPVGPLHAQGSQRLDVLLEVWAA